MKVKYTPIVKVERFPDHDTFIVQKQYTEGGPLFTLNNNGKGYSEDEAHNLAGGLRADVIKNQFNAPRV